ncbi:MAG: MTAP family purine nucleoside phosphorylase [Rhodoglobus sp.]
MPDSVAHAVIGGSGLYSLFDEPSTVSDIRTPYGAARISIGELDGRRLAFLPRHGSGHTVAPHLINYRANIWALASLGVRSIVSTAAVGGLHPDYPVGSLVLTDQYLDRTSGRADTFYDGDSVQHLASADPFCRALHDAAADALGDEVIATGTVAVIQGPRFSTRAESEWFRAAGAHIVNMTLYPEVPLAAELSVGTVNLAFVTDGDAAVSDEPVTAELVFARLREAQPRIIRSIRSVIAAIPADYRARDLIDPSAVAAVLAR